MVVCRFESCGRSQTTSVPDQLVASVRPSLDPVQVSQPLVSRDPLWGSLLAAPQCFSSDHSPPSLHSLRPPRCVAAVPAASSSSTMSARQAGATTLTQASENFGYSAVRLRRIQQLQFGIVNPQELVGSSIQVDRCMHVCT